MIFLFIRKVITDFFSSLSFFSRLPIHYIYNDFHFFSFARSIWIWPFISAFIGGLEGCFIYTLSFTTLSSSIIAFSALGFHLLLTGCLHEDGLADCADGFGGGHSIDQKLTIMKDSRLGTYGVLTLLIVLGIQITSVISLMTLHQKIIPLLTAIAVLSRSSMLIPIFILSPVQSKSMASQLDHIPFIPSFIHFTVTISICLYLLNWKFTILYLLVSFITGFLFSLIINNHIKGYNGDCLGAVQVLSTTALLVTSNLLFI